MLQADVWKFFDGVLDLHIHPRDSTRVLSKQKGYLLTENETLDRLSRRNSQDSAEATDRQLTIDDQWKSGKSTPSVHTSALSRNYAKLIFKKLHMQEEDTLTGCRTNLLSFGKK